MIRIIPGLVILKKSDWEREINSRLRAALAQFVDRVFYPMEHDLSIAEKRREIETAMNVDDLIKEFTSKSRRVGGKRKIKKEVLK